jgi:hypothetical protein
MGVRCLQADDVNLLTLPDEAEIHKAEIHKAEIHKAEIHKAEIHKAEHLVQRKPSSPSNLSDLSMVITVELRYEARGMVYTAEAHEMAM